jgi:short subunit dehydrogenase-like uncharacterized protein
VNTVGPFQSKDFTVAEACIRAGSSYSYCLILFGSHYVDIADSRPFVSNISELNEKAKNANVLVISVMLCLHLSDCEWSFFCSWPFLFGG